MKFCPYCKSDQIIRIDRISEDHSAISNPLFSSATITAVCTQLAKGMKVSPLVGTAIGIVVSGVAIVIQEHFAPKKLSTIVSVMFCTHCQHSFDYPNTAHSGGHHGTSH